MNRVVCLVCDIQKSSVELAMAERDGLLAYCDGCGKRTRNREVASDQTPIAPQSALTFAQQRRIFEHERKRA